MMMKSPEKDRGTTGPGRPIDPARRNHLGREGSVPHPSHPTAKFFTLPVVLVPLFPVFSIVKRVTSGFVLVQPDLRKPARPLLQAGRNEEVGGSGGIGTAATGGPRAGGRESSAARSRWRSRRSLSVTCTLRRFPTPARPLTGSRGPDSPNYTALLWFWGENRGYNVKCSGKRGVSSQAKETIGKRIVTPPRYPPHGTASKSRHKFGKRRFDLNGVNQ